MKILWVCNKGPSLIYKSCQKGVSTFGGWLDNMCENIVKDLKNELTILFLSNIELSDSKNNFTYISFTEDNCNKIFLNLLENNKYDVIHIWGTEFKHTQIFIKIVSNLGMINRTIISIQGLVSIIGKYHYTEGLPSNIIHNHTFKEVIKHNNIYRQKKSFENRGKSEIKALQLSKNVIGRTDWDKACVLQINPTINYFFCNESLRDVFYNYNWNINNIRRHSIFISQCSYPIKGFHYVLEAFSIVLKTFPDAHIYTTGVDLLNMSFIQKLKMNSYQKYLKKLIQNFSLENKVTFLGTLTAEEMAVQYSKANVFVSASTIENSPNSVGEAMLVGCPVVTSDVGGVKNLITHNEEGFIYQSTAPYMLAHYIMNIFNDDKLALSFSKNAKQHAAITHNREHNFSNLCTIYNNIINKI